VESVPCVRRPRFPAGVGGPRRASAAPPSPLSAGSERIMNDVQVGRVVRALRHRLRLTQRELAARAGCSREALMHVEGGRVGRLSVGSLRAIAAALGAEALVVVRYRGAELDRLLDAGHARLQDRWKRRLESYGWTVWVEVSFNHYGDRGRVDLFAWHVGAGLVLIVEVKTVVADLQSLIGSLDVKVRVAPHILPQLGIRAGVSVVPALAVADTSTNRRRIRAHESLFARYALRGSAALAWLRAPRPTGAAVLLFTSLPKVAGNDLRQPGRQRVRRPQAPPRSTVDPRTAESASSAG